MTALLATIDQHQKGWRDIIEAREIKHCARDQKCNMESSKHNLFVQRNEQLRGHTPGTPLKYRRKVIEPSW